jgi:hypothetical protein
MTLYPFREGTRLHMMTPTGPTAVDVRVPEQRKIDRKTGDAYVRGKCSVCSDCWIQLNGEAAGKCIYGGPYHGYVRVE